MTLAGPIHGFDNGDRVRDIRTGALGRVRFLELSLEELESGEYATAEVTWDGSFVADELDLAAPHLVRHTDEDPDAGRQRG